MQAKLGDTLHMLRPIALLPLLLVLACDSPGAEPPEPPKPDKSESGKQPPKSDTCVVAGLEAARSVEMVRIPSGCRVLAGGTIAAPTVVQSVEELASALECDANSERPTIDFAKHQLMLATFSMSPAYGGSEVLDDGTKVTFVQRDRSPCPDDPMPMPMNSTLAYLLPKGEARTFHQAACTLPPKCD